MIIKMNAARCDVSSDGQTFTFKWKGKGSDAVAEVMKLRLKQQVEKKEVRA